MRKANDVSGEKPNLASIDEQNVTASGVGGDGVGKNASATNVTNVPIEKPDDSAQSNAAVGVGIGATAPFTLIALCVHATKLL